jgi:hypothetical protein
MALAAAGGLDLLGCAVAQPQRQEEPVIVFEYHGANRGYGSTEFSLSLFPDGVVVFDGKNRTRVAGETRSAVAPQKVSRWLETLVNDGALSTKDYPKSPDTPWYRLTVVSEGRRGSIRFSGWNTFSPTIRILDEILNETQVFERWVGKQ